VPTGFSGYFNVQSEPTPGAGSVVGLYFDDGGTGSFAGQAAGEFTYNHDTWIKVEIFFDLDTDMSWVYFDGVLVNEFANIMTIGGIDYFGADTGGAPGAYFDNVCFEEGEPSLFPEITWDPTSFTQNVAVGGMEQDLLTLGNIGQADLEYTISTEIGTDVSFEAPKLDYSVLNKTIDNAFADIDMNSVSEKPLFTDEMWDIQILFDQVPAAVSQAGVETDGEYIYSAVWNAGDFVKFDFDGNVIEIFQGSRSFTY